MSLENFIPCRNGHAIREASLVLFLDEQLKNFSQYKDLYDKGEFSHFSIAKRANININFSNDKTVVEETDSGENGFKFESVVDDKVQRVFRGLNEPERSFIGFHELQYSRWANFKELFVGYFNKLFQAHNHYVNAFSLHFIDEFLWEENTKFPFDEVFKPNNKILPEYFYEGFSSDYTLTRRIQNKEKSDEYVDRISLNLVSEKPNGKSILVLSHNFTRLFDSHVRMDSVFSESFESDVDHAHNRNKELLKELFSNIILDKINFDGRK